MSKSPLEQAAADRKPGIARLSHVESLLKAEPQVASKLGAETVDVERRDGKIIPYNRMVFETTVYLMSQNVEPMQAPRAQIIDAAVQLCLSVGVAAAPTPKVEAATPKVEAAPKTEAKAEKRKLVPVAPVEPEVQVETASPAPAPQADAAVNIQVCIYSLLATAQELSLRDTLPGADERRATIKKVANQYREKITR